MPRNLQPPRSSKTQRGDRMLHVSRELVPVNLLDGTVTLAPAKRGKTFNDGRNKAKREARAKSAAYGHLA